MDAKQEPLPLLLLLLLFLLISLQSPAAHPVSGLSPAKELASMEALLRRLEEEVSLMEGLPEGPGFEGPGFQRGDEDLDEEDALREEEQQEEWLRAHRPRPQPRLPPPGRSPLLKRMMGLRAPKSMRDSGCFGRRLDRIGAVSGLGCKGLRRN